MNILLTGGAGYIGSNTALALLDRGHQITIIDNLSTGNKNLVPSNANFIKCNINDSEVITKILQKNNFDALIHFAGFVQVEESVRNPDKYFDNNTLNSKILFETCIKNNLRNIIFSSTAAAYGNPTVSKPINEETSLRPLNPYGQSKVESENFLINNNKVKYIIFRYFNVAGADPLLRSGLISKVSTHLIKIASEVATGKRKRLTIFGRDYPTNDGTAVRDYIHVTDLADIHVKGAEYLLSNKDSIILNCGYGKGYSVKEVVENTNKLIDKPIAYEYGNRRSGDAAILVSDNNKLKNTFNWQPKYNDLSLIIKSSIEWEKKLLNK